MMARYLPPIFLILLLVAVLVPDPAISEAMDGTHLARRVYDRDDGEDAYAKIRMLLIDKRKKKRFRTLITAVKEYGDTIRSYTRFTSPADIDGTSFLTWENKDREDDQFLYLPALKRVRRIVSTQKKNRFVNTDYTYEDLQRRQVDEDDHKILRAEKVGRYNCLVLESIPRNLKETKYGKRISWIVKEGFLPIKIDYYDKRKRHIKTYTARRIKKIDGIWSVMESEMHDLKRKHRTFMKKTELHYNRGIPDKVFTKAYMRHAK